MTFSGEKESVSLTRHRGIRPFCRCCGGGEQRPGYTCSKSVSRKQSQKARRAKPKSKDHR